MKNLFKKVSLVSVGLLTPVFAFAQDTSGIHGLLSQFEILVARLIPILIGLALFAFLWGVLGYLFKKGEDKKEARNFILFGLIALLVMTSVWGLVAILRQTILPGNGSTNQINREQIPNIPSTGVR